MDTQKSDSKRLFVLFLIVLVLFSTIIKQTTVFGSNQDNTIRIGEWTNSDSLFYMDNSPRWSGSFSDGNDSIMVTIYKDPKTYDHEESFTAKEIDINNSKVKKAIFHAEGILSAAQMPESLQPVRLGIYIICDFNSQRFIFQRTSDLGRRPGTREERNKFIEDSIQEAIAAASSDPLISFVNLFFEKDIEIGQKNLAEGTPRLEASIGNKEFVELKSTGPFKGSHYSWILPAAPGLNVKYRVNFPNNNAMTVTTHGLLIRKTDEVLDGQEISIGNKKFTLNNSGAAQLDYGIIEGPQFIELKFNGMKNSYSVLRGNVFLRWGRPEEKWLDDNNFPLAEKITNPTIDNCIGNLLNDLNIAYDWDRNCWIPYRGEQRTEYNPDYSDFSTLEDFALDEFPQLSTLNQKKAVEKWLKSQFSNIFWKPQYNETGEVTIDDVNLIQNDLVNLNLDNKMTSYLDDGPSSWHHPFEVLMLAYLWNEFPELREKNPVEKIFDFWIEAMKDNPDPVYGGSKAGAVIDERLYSRAYAIAALNIGYELFKKPEYKEAFNIQVKRFEEYVKKKGFLDSIINLEGWKDKTFGFSTDRDRQMCEAVSLYGQVCVLIGDEQGLKQVQEWIKTALTREGTQGQNAFRNYESATFKDRCGFIAILRGKSTFSELPLKRDLLLN